MSTLPPLTADQARTGRKVVITFNPHHHGGDGVIGTIASAPEPGPFGTQLVHVRYINPADGTDYELPFGLANLSAGDTASLRALAARHEAIAAELREMATRA